MRTPVGPLGMTDDELAESLRTGKYPERAIEALGRRPGFGPATTNPSPPNPSPLTPAQEREAFEHGNALRDYWRLDGKDEGKREGLEEGLRKGRLEGEEKGRFEGREQVLRENLTEALEAAKDVAAASGSRGVGRPAGRRVVTADAEAMREIRETHPGRDFVHLFKQGLKNDYPDMRRTSANRRAREGKALLEDWDRDKK